MSVPIELKNSKKKNSSLKVQVEDLRRTLKKNSSSSKYLDMILGVQSDVYNKVGLGYRPMQKEVKFMSFISRNTISRSRVTKAWVPKSFVVNATAIGSNICVLKHLVFCI